MLVEMMFEKILAFGQLGTVNYSGHLVCPCLGYYSDTWNLAYERLLVSEPGFSFNRLLLEILHDTETFFGVMQLHIFHIFFAVFLGVVLSAILLVIISIKLVRFQKFFQAHIDYYYRFEDVCSTLPVPVLHCNGQCLGNHCLVYVSQRVILCQY